MYEICVNDVPFGRHGEDNDRSVSVSHSSKKAKKQSSCYTFTMLSQKIFSGMTRMELGMVLWWNKCEQISVT